MARSHGFRSVLRVMNERCKHDLLPGQCGLCPVPSGGPAERPCEKLAAWLGRFAGTPM